MGITERRLRERAAQRRLITEAARALAEAEGWDAVTTRRLANEIEYSQPVIYKHFASMEEVIEAVALEGFGELAGVLEDARRGDGPPEEALSRVAHAFARFSAENPRLYEAMFIRATRLQFGGSESPPELAAGFDQLRQAVAAVNPGPDLETRTEVLWAALHGLTTLARNRRLRPGRDADRLALLVDQFREAAG